MEPRSENYFIIIGDWGKAGGLGPLLEGHAKCAPEAGYMSVCRGWEVKRPLESKECYNRLGQGYVEGQKKAANDAFWTCLGFRSAKICSSSLRPSHLGLPHRMCVRSETTSTGLA